jgi:hypothetical protein
MKFSSDGTQYAATVEVSTDNGKTWKHWHKDVARKVGKSVQTAETNIAQEKVASNEAMFHHK